MFTILQYSVDKVFPLSIDKVLRRDFSLILFEHFVDMINIFIQS